MDHLAYFLSELNPVQLTELTRSYDEKNGNIQSENLIRASSMNDSLPGEMPGLVTGLNLGATEGRTVQAAGCRKLAATRSIEMDHR